MNKLALFIAAVLRDLTRDRATLVTENAFLRVQLQVFKAQIPRPKLDAYDRALLVFLSSIVRRWKALLVVVEPRTLVSWANDGFRGFWAKLSRPGRKRPGRKRLAPETLELIRDMALKTTWGAKRIVGELRTKFNVRVTKRTVQKLLRELRPPRPYKQRWRTFLLNHLHATWASDFFTVPTLWFGQLHVFFVMRLDTRAILHWNVTFNPTSDWTAQQLKNVLAWCQVEPPRFFIRDADGKYGSLFDEIARGAGIEPLVISSPLENAYAERFVRTVRQEILRHFVVIGEKHLRWILSEYIDRHYNRQRPHQGLGQQIPAEVNSPVSRPRCGRVVRDEILNGLITEYRRAA